MRRPLESEKKTPRRLKGDLGFNRNPQDPTPVKSEKETDLSFNRRYVLHLHVKLLKPGSCKMWINNDNDRTWSTVEGSDHALFPCMTLRGNV